MIFVQTWGSAHVEFILGLTTNRTKPLLQLYFPLFLKWSIRFNIASHFLLKDKAKRAFCPQGYPSLFISILIKAVYRLLYLSGTDWCLFRLDLIPKMWPFSAGFSYLFFGPFKGQNAVCCLNYAWFQFYQTTAPHNLFSFLLTQL